MTASSPRVEQLVATRAVHVRHDDGLTVRALVDGTDRTHAVDRNPDGWSCTCPSWRFRHRCAHVEAVQAATEPAAARQMHRSDLQEDTPHLSTDPMPQPTAQRGGRP